VSLPAQAAVAAGPDLERRFGALRRLYGAAAYERLRALRIAIVGLGGVGSWAAEALARCGVAGLTLIDFDQVAESNINRQVQALGTTVGQAKGEAMRQRIADIHPGCAVRLIDDFVTPQNWPGLLEGAAVDGLIDACDQLAAKATLAAWALTAGRHFVGVGAAGGKRRADGIEVADLAVASHDPLLSALRQRLRRHHGAARSGPIGVPVVFSREPVAAPSLGAGCAVAGDLNCHGYGSSVMVTAAFGLVAAQALVERCIQGARRGEVGPL
jgi:tRNA A37 threonylcarbamoyladenosine dehydratase